MNVKLDPNTPANGSTTGLTVRQELVVRFTAALLARPPLAETRPTDELDQAIEDAVYTADRVIRRLNT